MGKGCVLIRTPDGPNPLTGDGKASQYVAHIQTGTIQLVDRSGSTAKLGSYTQEVLANTPYRDEKLADAGIPAGSPVRPDGPIKHVIYIVKENRTYDQVLGDMKEGNGDPSLVLFGEKSTPNFHKIAREFVLLDNFYVNSDVSADGHNWATAAIAPDYTQRLWPSRIRGAAQDIRFRRRGAGQLSAGRLSLEQRRPGRCLDAQLRIFCGESG